MKEPPSSSGPNTDNASLAILTTLGCGFCRKTKAALSNHGIQFQDIDLSRQLHVLGKAKELTGQRTVPQVFVDGHLLGGYTETLKLLDNGELQNLIRSAKGDPLPEELNTIINESVLNSQEDLEKSLLPPGLDMSRYCHLLELHRQLRDNLATTTWTEFRPLSQSFTAKKAMEWLKGKSHAGDDAEARLMLEQMMTAHLLEPADADAGNGLPKLLRVVPTANRKSALNAMFRWQREARSASEVAEILRNAILGLYEKHLTADGKAVQYKALAQDPVFQLFVAATAELQRVDPRPLSRDERFAFFLNVYNIIIIHAQAVLGGPGNLLARLSWFSSIKYIIGGLEYSADDIEHGLLRGNRPASSSISVLLGHPEWAGGYFKHGDPRLRLVIPDMDRRLHFALNCGAKSCPPIKVYTAETLEEGLQSAAAAFCEGEVDVNSESSTVTVSKIFKWYRMDFGDKHQLLTWLIDYLPDPSAQALQGLLKKGVDRIKLDYKEYDWDLNTA